MIKDQEVLNVWEPEEFFMFKDEWEDIEGQVWSHVNIYLHKTSNNKWFQTKNVCSELRLMSLIQVWSSLKVWWKMWAIGKEHNEGSVMLSSWIKIDNQE